MKLKKITRGLLLYITYFFVGAMLLAYLSVHVSPADFLLLSYAGLAYPFILIGNIVLLIIWAYRKDWAFLIPLVTILIGYNYLKAHFQLPLSAEKKEKTHISMANQEKALHVTSYNVRLFNRYNWTGNSSSTDSMTLFLKQNDPDILCLQEYYINPKNRYQSGQWKGEPRFLGYSHVHFLFETPEGAKYGIATFSKYPIVRKGHFIFENTSNLCIFTDIKINHDTLRVYNNHLQSIRLQKQNYALFNKLNLRDEKQLNEIKELSYRLRSAFIKRAEQVDIISRSIKDSPYPVIVCGDFNDPPVSYTYHKMKGQLKDAYMESGLWAGNTYTGFFPSFRIDYIFYSQELESRAYNTHRVKFSDHYPVSCYILFE